MKSWWTVSCVTMVTVWTTLIDPASFADRGRADTMIADQRTAIQKLWKEGVIENVYFDVDDARTTNDVTDFVFFVNATSEAKAREIIHELPFHNGGLARYNLYPVGMRWLQAATTE